jgi:DNA-binding response OmpR family regulator
VVTFVVNHQKFEDLLGYYEIKFSGKYRTYINDHGIAIIERIDKSKGDKALTCNCGALKLDINTGDVFLYNTKANFKPDMQEFILIKLLLTDSGRRYTYEEISDSLGKKVDFGYREVSYILRNIKKKLCITGKNKTNKDVFDNRNGLRIIC